jgi:hypothetical protein
MAETILERMPIDVRGDGIEELRDFINVSHLNWLQ